MSQNARAVGDGSLDPETAAKAASARDALGEREGVLVAFSGASDPSPTARAF